MIVRRILLLFVLSLAWPAAVLADGLSQGLVFQDGMVLQQGVPLPITGTAKPGQSVTVAFAEQKKTAQADALGRWSITLDPLQTSNRPRELNVLAGQQSQTIHDVLVGEVWIAAGQSNMEFTLAKESHAAMELPSAELPALRLLNLNFAGQDYSAKSFGPDVCRRLTPAEFYRGTWRRCSPTSAKDFSAVAYYFAKKIHQTLQTPVGIIHLAVGGSPTEAWIRREALAQNQTLAPLLEGDWLKNEQQDKWCRERGMANLAAALKSSPPPPRDALGPNHPFKPGFLWEAGIARIAPFPIRGVIWYQGESNSLSLPRTVQHEKLFPLLVADWRKQWGIGEFPFYYCQLSSIGTEKGYQSHHWPEFRDGQRRMLETIPGSGMAVTSDLGHPSDVHPRNKQDVGHRLALCALAKTYDKPIEYSGPLPKSIRGEGQKLIVAFDHVAGGLVTSDAKAAAGFEIAGKDGVFRAAQVQLEKERAVLTSPSVTEPAEVRYAWQPYSNGNLVNAAGLPASTFRMKLPEK